MAVASDSPPNKDSTSSSTTSKTGGFRSFWKSNSDKSSSESPGDVGLAASPQDDVEIEGSSQRRTHKGNRISRILKRGSTTGSEGQEAGEGGKQAASEKRRQQIYQAQKRHRNRRAEYIKSLEDEVAKWRNLDSHARQEKSLLEDQNQRIKEVLASHSIDAQLGSMTLAVPSSTSRSGSGSGSASASASAGLGDVEMTDFNFAAIDIRFDNDLFHERTYLDQRSGSEGAMAWSSTTSGGATPDAQQHQQHQHLQHLQQPQPLPMQQKTGPVKGDSWAAVDFILALEWPCRDHVHYPGSKLEGPPSQIDPSEDFTGHILTATSAVYGAAIPPATHLHKENHGSPAKTAAPGKLKDSEKWLLPHSEIEKLVKMSENLPLDDQELTPAQAYSAIRQNLTCDEDLKPVLELLKIPLGVVAECRGYGAVLPADHFWQHFETALTSLNAY